MTVASTQNRKSFAGDNVTTSFGTSPVVFALSSDIDVYVTDDTTGVATTLVENTHYTVTGGGGAVGTVDFTGGSSPWGPLLTDTTLVLVRTVELTQEADFVQNDISDAEVTEAALDKLTYAVQQLDSRVDRSFRLADSDISGISLIVTELTAGEVLIVNDAGTAIETTDPGSVALAIPADSSVTNAKMADMAANTVKVNATASSAAPTDLALAASRLLGRGATGNLAAVTLGSGLAFAAAVLDLAPAAANTVKANATAGSAIPTDVALSASNLLGRGSTGNVAAITLGAGLSMSGTVLSASSGITQGTSQATTSGTVKDFTGIPAGTKRVVVSLHGVSTNGSSDFLIQIGDAGGIENTGYNSQACDGGTPTTSTAGFVITDTVAAGRTYYGTIILTLVDAATFTWAATGNICGDTSGAVAFYSSGGKALSAGLTQVRLTSVTPDTFDAGLVNIQYE